MAKYFRKSGLVLAVLACFSHHVAASDILKEESFKASSILEVNSPIDSILLYKKNVNRDDDFTINLPSGNSLQLNPTQDRGIVVNRYKNKLSLTINSNVSIGDANQRLTIKKHNIDSQGLYETALVQVGNGSRINNSGHLQIDGDLSIQNVDFSSASHLISLGGGSESLSSFSVKDVTIRDVTGSKLNSVIYSDYADVTFGNIVISNATAGSAIKFGKQTHSQIASLTLNGGSFKKNAVSIVQASILGDVTVQGTQDHRVEFTDSLIALEDSATIGGDIHVQHVAGGNRVIYANQNGQPENRYFFKNIHVLDSELIGSTSYQDGVISLEQLTYDLDSAFVENASFSRSSINEVSGIRIASAHTEQRINALSVTNLNAAATSGDTVHGISFETSSAKQGIERVSVDGVHGVGVKTKGFSIIGAYNKNEEAYEQHFGTVSINNITAQSKNAYGMYVTSHSSTPSVVVLDKTTSITNIVAEAPNSIAYGIRAQDLTLNGGLIIKGLDATYKYGVRAGQAFVDGITINANEGTINQIEGDLIADKGGKLNASFGNDQSYLLGQVYASEGGTVNANFDHGAYWNVTNNSTLTTLHLGQDSRVDLTYQIDAHNRKTHVVTANAFDALNGQLVMRIDPTVQADTTQLVVNGEASGKFSAVLDVVNGDQITADNPKSLSWLISQNSGTLAVDKVSFKDGAAKAFDLRFFEDGSQDSQGQTTSTGNSGKWHLVMGTAEPENPDKPPVTPEVDQVLSLGASVAQGLGMLSETEDLRMRMGDIRNGVSDGAWVRTYARRDTAHGSYGNGFEQDTYGIHVGADRVVKAGEQGSWLLGGALHYGKSDMDGVADTNGGAADVDQYSFKAYATYMHDDGVFADVVLHAGYYENELTGRTNAGLGYFTAEYDNWGYGVSAEVGRRISLGEGSGWYAEPTAQLTWFHVDGEGFKTSTGLEITQSDADFVTGRAGMALGKVFAFGTQADPMSSFVSVALKGGMLYQFDGDQTITARGTDKSTVQVADAMDMDGLRGYYGLTADWQINDTWRLYGQVSREQGSGYNKDFDASFGVQYRW